jgi:hypothetical protein
MAFYWPASNKASFEALQVKECSNILGVLIAVILGLSITHLLRGLSKLNTWSVEGFFAIAAYCSVMFVLSSMLYPPDFPAGEALLRPLCPVRRHHWG